MIQQIIALAIIALFVWRLISQKRNNKIKQNEFLLWLIFWLLGAIAIIFIKQLDTLLDKLGFSGSGINFLLYLTVIILFYLVFKLRLQFAKLDANLTKIVRHLALDKENKDKDHDRRQ